MKLNLGSGRRVLEGYVNVDIVQLEGVDQVVDLFQFPWPWEDGSVDEIYSRHFFEHVPGKLRMKFMDECYRVLAPEGKMTFIVPYYASVWAIQDPTHEWPPIAEASFWYFNKAWREDQKLEHYDAKCDFDFRIGFMPANTAKYKLAEMEEKDAIDAINHCINVVTELQVELTRRA